MYLDVCGICIYRTTVKTGKPHCVKLFPAVLNHEIQNTEPRNTEFVLNVTLENFNVLNCLWVECKLEK